MEVPIRSLGSYVVNNSDDILKLREEVEELKKLVEKLIEKVGNENIND